METKAGRFYLKLPGESWADAVLNSGHGYESVEDAVNDGHWHDAETFDVRDWRGRSYRQA